MNRNCIMMLCVGVLCLNISHAQNLLRDVVYLKNGSVINGTIIEIVPEQTLKMRTPDGSIFVVSVSDVDSISKAELPSAQHYEADVVTEQQGFPTLLGFGSFGYASVGGKYYEGLNSGSGFRLGLHYYFPDSDPYASRFILGFTHNHSSIKGDQIYGFDPELNLIEYSLEFGRTTRLYEGGHYLYFLMGLVFVANELSLPVQLVNFTYSETKAAIRLEGDASVHVVNRFSILVSLGYDVVLGKKASSSYNTYVSTNPSDLKIAGGIFQASIGLMYGL